MWPEDAPGRIGYVLKMYPRFSETFVVTELLALQELGVPFEVFSLRLPADGRFHTAVSKLDAAVTYLGSPSVRAQQAWDVMAAARQLPGWDRVRDDLFTVAVGDAVQAVDLAQQIIDRRITHLHAHFASVSARVARLAAGLAGIGYSVTTHAKDIFHEAVDAVDLARVLGDAAFVVAISEYNRDHLLAAFPELHGRIRLVRNGLDLPEFPFHDDVPARPARVAAVGRLVEKKGFDVLLRAVALLRDSGLPVPLDLVGTGERAAELTALVRSLDLTELVVLHGAQPQHRVREIVRGAAVLAAPCVVGVDGNRDGLPTVLLEAMALGTPCVATPVTGIAEAVIDGRTGLLVPPNDHVGLAMAVRSLLADRATGARLTRAARHHVEELHDTRRQAGLLAAGFRAVGVAKTFRPVAS